MSILKIIIIFFVFLKSAYTQNTGTYILQGKVTDKNQNPIEQVLVNVHELNLLAITDRDGKYFLENIPEGKYFVTFNRYGYKTLSMEILMDVDLTDVNAMLTESMIETPVIDVTSSFNPTDVSKSPYSVSQMSSRELHKQKAQTLAETIQNIPGISNISTGPFIGKPMIRGLSFQSILIIHNNVKHESQMWGEEHGPEFSLFDIDRIEVLRGPSSLMFGAEGLGGVINIIQKPLFFLNKKTFFGELNLGRYSVNNQYRTDFLFGYGDKELGFKTHFGYKKSGNIETPSGYFKINTQEGSELIDGGIIPNSGSKEIDGGVNLGLNYSLGNLQLEFETMYRDVQLPESDFTKTPNQKLITNQLSLKNLLIISKKFKLETSLSYQNQSRKEFESIETNTMDEPSINLNIKSINGSMHFHHDLNAKVSGTFGISFNQQSNRTLAEEKLIPNYNSNTYGVFLVEKCFTELFTFSSGFRYDYKNTSMLETVFITDSLNIPTSVVKSQNLNFNSITGSFGLVYSPSGIINFFTNIGKGWRPPSEFEIFVDGVHEGTGRYDRGLRTIDQNYQPKPEELLNTDFGFRLDYKYVNLQFSFFKNFIDNFVYPSPTSDTLDGFPVYNIKQDKSTFVGYEYYLQLQFFKWMIITMSGDFVKTNNLATGYALPFTPAMKNIFEIRFQKMYLGGFYNPYIMFNAKFISPQKDVDPLESKTEGYTLFKLGAGFELSFAGSLSSFDITIDNLFNLKYVDHLSRLNNFALNPGRSINVQLNIPFRL